MTREDLPHIQFYIGDWRRDVGVQSLSYHYRGVWLELLMLMHCSEERGRLVLRGKPMSDDSISRLLGLSRQEGANAIQVLLESAVASRDSDGAFICRRMVKEAEISAARRRSGSKGLAKRWQIPDNDDGNEVVINPEIREQNLAVRKDRAKSLEEVATFCLELKLEINDGEWFWHKCEANGWLNNGKPIKDWRATLRSWKAAGYLPSQKIRPTSNPHLPPPARRMSSFEIKERIGAIGEEIKKIWNNAKNFQVEKYVGKLPGSTQDVDLERKIFTPESKTELDRLKAKKEELRKELTK